MSVVGWFITGVGIAGAAYTFHIVAGKIAWTYNHYPDVDNVFGGFLIGAMAACLWPVVLPCLMINKHGKDGMASIRYFIVERLLWRPDARAEITQRRR